MHPAAKRINDIAGYSKSLALGIDNGSITPDSVPNALSYILRLLCNEIITWKREFDPAAKRYQTCPHCGKRITAN